MPLGIIKINLTSQTVKRLLANTTLADHALCPIAPQQLCNILLLPAEYQSVRVQYSDHGYINTQIELIVEHPGIPEVEPGQELPRLELVYVSQRKAMILQDVVIVKQEVAVA